MTFPREQIIAWAREAGFKVNWQHADVAEIKAQRYERFAALIEQATIERCAKVCEELDDASYPSRRVWPSECAAAIRALKEKQA